MATAKKAKKSRKTTPKVAPSRKHRRFEKAETPEELLAQLPAVTEEHDREVAILGKRILLVLAKSKFHPTVVLDTLQMLLSVGIADTLGEDQGQLFDSHIHAFHQESRMLSIVNMLGGSLADLIVDPGSEEQPPASETDSEATALGGPNDYSQGT